MRTLTHTYRINDLLICITLYLCQSNFRDICSEEEEFGEDKLQMKSDGPQLRHRSQFSGIVLLSLYEGRIQFSYHFDHNIV
jgi:hypothetical protein